MKVKQPDTFLKAVASLQQLVQKSPSIDAIRQQAAAVGFDPDFADQLYRRVRGQKAKRLVDKSVSQKQIFSALLGMLAELETEDKADQVSQRVGLWASARLALQNFTTRFGVALQETHDVVTQTGMGFYPNLEQLAQELGKAMHQEPPDFVDWKKSLLASFKLTERGKNGERPQAEDVEILLLDMMLADKIQKQGGPGHVLRAQAESIQAHRRVGAALSDLES